MTTITTIVISMMLRRCLGSINIVMHDPDYHDVADATMTSAIINYSLLPIISTCTGTISIIIRVTAGITTISMILTVSIDIVSGINAIMNLSITVYESCRC